MMKKVIRSFVLLFLITVLTNSSVIAQSSIDSKVLATAPPTVKSPLYLCQNSMATPLTATPAPGGTLNWYTTFTGGVALAGAPTPSTTTVLSTTYYVTQTIGGIESTPRTPIVINVVADNGATLLNFRCDPSQVAAADKYSSVMFDWSNNPLINDNKYNYSYSIQGGPIVTGSTTTSHQQVFGMVPGQSATLTLTAASFPCVPSQTITCTVPCLTTITPDFPPISPFCTGTTAPILGNTSPNMITGTWSPSSISTTVGTKNYVFTPDPVLFPCALTQTLVVTVDPLVTPAFSGIPAIVCQGGAAPVLPLISSNVTPINGIWSPASVNTAVLGSTTYTFTPNPGQCVTATPTTVTIKVDPVLTPTFTPVAPVCSGTALASLPTTSTNNITGTWSPVMNNTATTTYSFTPAPGQCANGTTMVINVIPNVTPTFTQVLPICSGTFLSPLPTTSIEGITGTWSPGLNTSATTTYTFTPTTGQCAATATMTITVNPIITPVFAFVPDVCVGDTMTPLPTTSTNGILGTWSPALNNAVTTLYTFNPTAGQCATFTTLTINVNPIVTPAFAAIPPLCFGSTAPILASTSPNGISGTWSPAVINNTVGGNYVFTPTIGQCALSQTLNVSITPRIVTNFAAISPFCSGATAPILSNISPNGVTGTWNPATIDNTTSGSYVFTPNPSECATPQTLSVVIIPLIDPDFDDLVSVCSGETPPVLETISPNGISGTWSPSVINNNVSGAYVFTPDAPQCATVQTINVTVHPSDTLTDVSWTVTDAFTNNQIVTITASGAGNYLFQLDSGPFQTSPIFENVASGMHSITVVDEFGCSDPIQKDNVLVVNFPKYFTPNGDNYNDTWKIPDLNGDLNSRIFIFDRYGKLLKEIGSNGNGWDGTYLGHPMPADDYWFTIEYSEQNVTKKFKSHFSLKR